MPPYASSEPCHPLGSYAAHLVSLRGSGVHRMTNDDFLAVIFSVIFVTAYIAFHNSSFALGAFGVLLIVLSFPLSLFAFALSRVAWFGSVHILVLFLVLGVVCTSPCKQIPSTLHPCCLR